MINILTELNGYVIANALPLLLCIFFGSISIVAGSEMCSKWFERRQRRRWSQQIRSLKRLQAMSWQEFEALTGELFRGKGYRVKETGGGGADGGVDLVLRKRRRKYLVQCKHSRDTRRSVSVRVVREIAGVVEREKAAGAILVTTGKFSKDAISEAPKLSVRLIDGPALLRLTAANRNTRLAPYPSPGARGIRR